LYTTKFKKDLKKFKSDFVLIGDFLKNLQEKGAKGVAATMKPHRPKGNYKDNWECHIKPDLLIIWFQLEQPKKSPWSELAPTLIYANPGDWVCFLLYNTFKRFHDIR